MSNNPHTFVLYSKEQLSFKSKFYILMDLLVTNQASSQMETYFFLGIFYIQMLSGYFSRHLNLLSIEGSKFDKILNYFEKDNPLWKVKYVSEDAVEVIESAAESISHSFDKIIEYVSRSEKALNA